MSTFLLVHGGWVGGWCWRRVTPLLEAAGHRVFTPTLTGLGERAHLCNAAIDLDTHIEDVVSVLQYEDLHEVVLVGHSYGGMVITGAAERAAERLAHLCYLDAFVPEDGQALADLVGPAIIADAREKAQLSTDGSRVPMPFPLAAVGIEKDADVVWMTPRLTPHPLNSMLQPVRLSNPAARALPRTFIYCSKPAMGFFERFAQKARSGWRYREIATGHTAMVTEPRRVADLLLELAA